MYKIPVSVLVVIHTADLQALLLERADHPGYWQSVTGSQDAGETLEQTAIREVFEETGLNASQYALTNWGVSSTYEIYPEWRWRYEPSVTHNTEHVFGLELPAPLGIIVAPREHLRFMWTPVQAAIDKVFSPSNAAALTKLLKTD